MPKKKIYKITTSAIVITEYLVEATNQEEAETRYWDGEVIKETPVDYRDEEILSVDKEG